METIRKSVVQLEDLRRRESFGLLPDSPMVRTLFEDNHPQFGYLPITDELVAQTPLGHYKTKLVEMGLDFDAIMHEVENRMRGSFAFHNENGRPIGRGMHNVLRHVVGDTILTENGFDDELLRATIDLFLGN